MVSTEEGDHSIISTDILPINTLKITGTTGARKKNRLLEENYKGNGGQYVLVTNIR